MQIHEKGFKGKRDRAKCAEDYSAMCSFFHIRKLKESEIAKLSNQHFYNLCQDAFNARTRAEKARYCEHEYGIGNPQYRRKPTAFKWYYIDLMRFTQASGFRRVWLSISSPFRYPRFLKRIAKSKADRLAKAEEKKE